MQIAIRGGRVEEVAFSNRDCEIFLWSLGVDLNTCIELSRPVDQSEKSDPQKSGSGENSTGSCGLQNTRNPVKIYKQGGCGGISTLWNWTASLRDAVRMQSRHNCDDFL